MQKLSLSILLLLLSMATYSVNAQQMARVLTLEDAQKISDAAEAKARANNWNVVIAVVDAGGHLIALRRMDGTQAGSVDVALRKSDSALKFKRPTKVFEDAVMQGRVNILSLPGIVAVEGGLPIKVGDQVIGAIGVSGVKSSEDGIIAAAGLAAFK
jgi:uncharacterized protein GlcG (DUF336 family)